MEAVKDPFKALELVETSPQAATSSKATRQMITEAVAKARGQREEKLAGSAWYELEGLIPYRDLLFVAGFALVVAGVALWSRPAALVVGGAGLMYLGWLMSK